MSFVVHVIGLLLALFGGLMFADAALFPETARIFLTGGVLVVLIGASLALSTSARLHELNRLHAFLLTAGMWIAAATAGAVPLWLWKLSPADAFFEAMSGITTTGSTVMTGLDTTAHGILFWRALLQWIGGIGFVVTGLALLPILRVGGMQLFRTESSELGEKEMTSTARFAMASFLVYTGLTVLCLLTYLIGGMTFFEAICHAMATLSTGGYSTSDSSFGHFQSGFLQWSATLFMLAGSLPFAWYIRVLRRGDTASEQVRMLVLSLTIATLLLTFWRVATAGAPIFETLRLTAFNVVSVVSTTGFATTDYTTWGSTAVVAFFLLTVVGGCTGSTSGGAKVMRWIILGRALRVKLRMIRDPHGVFALRYEGRAVEPDVLSGVISFFVLYAATVFGLAVILAFHGLDMETAVSGALTAVANVGPGIGSQIGPSSTFADLSDPVKWELSFGMYAGRLEMMTVFVLFTRTYWREIA
ncbi:TrkH family potassium uptake protein [Pseudooceanicola sp. CBS1P-1]|nr:TrkH family potassium uptake protein [Pseudooceanicola endophyticus]